MSDSTAQLIKENMKRRFPDIEEEYIEKSVNESLERVRQRTRTINLEEYNRESIIEYLIKEDGFGSEDAEDMVSDFFTYIDKKGEDKKYKPISEENKTKMIVGTLEVLKVLSW
jgi:hypothetical protein